MGNIRNFYPRRRIQGKYKKLLSWKENTGGLQETFILEGEYRGNTRNFYPGSRIHREYKKLFSWKEDTWRIHETCIL